MISGEDKPSLHSDAQKIAKACLDHAYIEARKTSSFDQKVAFVARAERGTRVTLSSDTLGFYPQACAMADAGLHKLIVAYGHQSSALIKGAAESIKWSLHASAQNYANLLMAAYDVEIVIEVDTETPTNQWGLPKLRLCVVSTKEEDDEVEMARKKVKEAINAYKSALKKRRAGEI